MSKLVINLAGGENLERASEDLERIHERLESLEGNVIDVCSKLQTHNHNGRLVSIAEAVDQMNVWLNTLGKIVLDRDECTPRKPPMSPLVVFFSGATFGVFSLLLVIGANV